MRFIKGHELKLTQIEPHSFFIFKSVEIAKCGFNILFRVCDNLVHLNFASNIISLGHQSFLEEALKIYKKN